ncbi:Rho termination factor N-terminal domain-containing protein, partial [Streptomyces sp. NPDC054933]
MSDTTDLMGVRADSAAAASDAAAPATGAATGSAPRRRRSGTGLEGMVLAELQQVASALGIKGTARMRKGQLIEVIKERQAGRRGRPPPPPPPPPPHPPPPARPATPAPPPA